MILPLVKHLQQALLAAASLLLLACSTPPMRPLEPLPATTPDFTVSARFALRQTLPDGSQNSLAGRLDWSHTAGADQLLLADPLGRGMAELWRDASGARLKLADGREFTAAEADTLLAQTLGYALPIRHMASWLTARRASERDGSGRPSHFVDGDWHIDYAYNDAGARHPDRITLRYAGEGELAGLELRLRIETWESTR